jgi:uncharacterized sulfatase
VLLGQKTEHAKYVFGVQTTLGIINGSPNYPVRSVRDVRYKYIRNLNFNSDFSNILTNKADGLLPAWRQAGAAAAQRVSFYVRRPAEELYDLKEDPAELRNLAGDPRLKAVQAQLREQLDQWMTQQGDRGIETELQAKTRQMKGQE